MTFLGMVYTRHVWSEEQGRGVRFRGCGNVVKTFTIYQYVYIYTLYRICAKMVTSLKKKRGIAKDIRTNKQVDAQPLRMHMAGLAKVASLGATWFELSASRHLFGHRSGPYWQLAHLEIQIPERELSVLSRAIALEVPFEHGQFEA